MYHKIVTCEGVPKDELCARLLLGVYAFYDSIQVQAGNDSVCVVSKGLFRLQHRMLGKVGHPGGEVAYRLVVQAKDNKYRYMATAFEYTALVRNRYGRYVRSGDRQMLTTDTFKNKRSQRFKYEQQIRAHLVALEQELESAVLTDSIKKTDW